MERPVSDNLSPKSNYSIQEVRLPPLWSSGQSSWPQIQRSEFDSQRYQIF
jgi:hypothetical protein